jgi:acetylcholinesterase
MLNLFGGGELADYLIHFVNHLDPNGPSGSSPIPWPKYSPESPQMLTFWDGDEPMNITQDDFRLEAMSHLQEIISKHRF